MYEMTNKDNNCPKYKYATAEERNAHIIEMCRNNGYICTKVAGGIDSDLIAEFKLGD